MEYKLRTSCPPRSPLIRSKYARKFKTTDQPQNYTSDPSTWQATPPRRLIRHKKVSAEKRPDISSLIEGDLSVNIGRIAQHDDHDQAWRNRALSDSHPALKKDSLSVPTSCGGSSEHCHYLFKYQQEYKQLPVSDVISRFESNSLHGSSYSCSGEVFRNSPSPGAIGRPTVSPVRRLKTAEELLQECSSGRQCRPSAGGGADRLSPGHDFFPSTSSEKYDNTQPVIHSKNNSKSSTPERSKESKASPKPGAFVSQAIRKLSVPESELKSSLQEMSQESSSKEGSPHRHDDPKLKELPRLGIVSKNAELFQAKIGAESQQRHKPLPAVGVDYNMKTNSSIDPNTQRNFSESPSSPVRRTRPEERPVTIFPPRSPPPPSVASPQSARSKGYSKLFARKVSPSSPTPSKTVSALCKQALHVDLESASDAGDSASERTASPDQRRPRAKFLDSNWLQKPRRFFKVSKYVCTSACLVPLSLCHLHGCLFLSTIFGISKKKKKKNSLVYRF